ncbi:VWA domain-containing protein [Marinobacter sp. VGCF2001]|uniref:vWA domain-containing protein n=1 Tax=Marinobacter sp. VGCF2001 TaxID=3417189 RepID=UPI003CF15B85
MERFKHAWVAAVFLLVSSQISAQEPTLSMPGTADVRIVVDISGSMKETDPRNLRRPAVRLLARILPEGASAGLWTFGQYVNMLVPYGVVDPAWRDTAIERSEQINSVALYTNLGLAMEKAADDWLSGGTLENTHVIVLSDGKVDVPGSAEVSLAEERRILGSLLPALKVKGATIHTVGLSERADIQFLRELASETGGSFQLAQSAEALNLAFANALNTAVPQEQVPIEGNGFAVDEGVSEFTALIFAGQGASDTEPLALSEPGGEPFTRNNTPENVRWASEPGYDLITVTEPAAGRWRIVGDLGQGSRVTVVSDLRMAVNPIPAEFSEDEPLSIEVAFFEDAEKITGSDFLSVMDVTLSITASDGRQGTKSLSPEAPPEDGVYRDSVPKLPAPGRYQIDVVADGGTFSRKFSAMSSFVVPGEEPPLEVVTEPMVPDLSEQVEPLPDFDNEPGSEETSPPSAGEDNETPEVSEPEPAAEPVPAPAPEPVSEAAAEPASDQPEPEKGMLWGVPVWAWGAGAAGLVAVVGLGLFAWRQKKARAEQEQAAAAERETLDDLAAVAEEPPVVEPEAEPEEAPAIEEPEPEPEAALEPEPEPEPEPETEQEPPELQEPEPESVPELPADDEITSDSAGEAIPEVTDELVSEEVKADETDIPLAEDLVPSEAEPDASEADDIGESEFDIDDDEFGLEDFDLSEFDDLPDYDDPSSDPEKPGSTENDEEKPKK